MAIVTSRTPLAAPAAGAAAAFVVVPVKFVNVRLPPSRKMPPPAALPPFPPLPPLPAVWPRQPLGPLAPDVPADPIAEAEKMPPHREIDVTTGDQKRTTSRRDPRNRQPAVVHRLAAVEVDVGTFTLRLNRR